MLAANRARGAGVLTGVMLQAQRLAGDGLRPIEVTTREVARRQHTHAIEEGDIGHGADLAVLGGCRTDAALGQIPRQRCHRARIGRPRQPAPAHCDRLQPLRAHHRAGAGATRQATVIGDRRVTDPVLPGGTDRRHSKMQFPAPARRRSAVSPGVNPSSPSAGRRCVWPSSMTSTLHVRSASQ